MILPTAVLTFIAVRTLRNWELVVERRFELSAMDAIRAVARRVEARLDDELDYLRGAMEETLLRRPAIEEIRNTAVRLRQTRPLVREVFVFMNPWGFMYPEGMETRDFKPRFSEPDDLRSALEGRPRREQTGETMVGTQHARDAEEVEAFVATLRREIETLRSTNSTIRLTVARSCYCFAPLPGWKGVYVGYEIDRSEFVRTVREILSAFSGSGIRLVAEGPGFEAVGQQLSPSDVVVTDSFSPESRSLPGEAPGEPVRGRLTETSLFQPFETVRIVAWTEDPDRVARVGAQQVRLHAWAIALLAAGVVVGVWLLFRETAGEIRRMRRRSDFVIGVSHDLRTPVSSVKMLAETLYLDRVSEPQTVKKFLGVIAREADRLNHLIERVLFFVRFDQDALEHAPRPTQIERFVRETVEAFRSRYSIAPDTREAASDVCHVTIRTVSGLPRVELDEGAMTQVLFNLLDNAVKYVRPGERPRVEVEVDCIVRRGRTIGRKRKWVIIAVRDNGIGISGSDLHRIFRRYYRTAEARRSNVSGVGLGLAMCQHIVRVHGGWIGVKSRVGEGSTFSVYLPAVGDG